MDTSGGTPGRDLWITAAAWAALLAVVAWTAWTIAVRPPPEGAALVDCELEVRSEYAIRSRSQGRTMRLEHAVVQLGDGDLAMRQRAAVLAGDLGAGSRPESWAVRARAALDAADEDAVVVQRALEELYPRSPGEGETQAARVARLSGDERAALVRRLGWFGRLALAPGDGDPREREAVISSARRTLAAMVVIVTFVVVGGLAGAALLVVGAILAAARVVQLRHDVPAGRRSFGAETFAVWLLVLEAGFRLAAPLLPATGAGTRLLTFVFEVATLAALAIAVVRGVPWAELRRRIGWHRGSGLFREIGAGLLGVPLDAALTGAGLLAYWVLVRGPGAGREPGEGAHPIVIELARDALPDAAVIALLAAVAAPLVEETMFRGVLYGHLREATSRWHRALSVVASALVSAVVFASLHPQGWPAVPALTGSGIAFALLREWRGSLVAPMVAHAVWNGSLVIFVRMALSP